MQDTSSPPRFRSSSRTLSIAAAVSLVIAAIAVAPPAQAASATVHGTLTGIKADNTTEVIAGAAIELRDATTNYSVGTAWTDSNGEFTITASDAGGATWGSLSDQFSVFYNYCLYNEPSCSDYPQEWLGGAYSVQDAETFTLTDGASVEKNHSIRIGATVKGSVTLADGTAATGGYVSAKLARPGGGSAHVNPANPIAADGTFEIRGVPSGVNGSLDFYREWDDDDERCYTTPEADLGVLTPGQTVTGADLVEEYNPSIIATVLDPDGGPVDFLGAVPYTNSGNGEFEAPQAGPFGTDEQGKFKHCAVVGTEMKLKFFDDLGANFGMSVDRTTPMVTTWVGTDGARGTTEQNAPVIEVDSTDVIDLGTIEVAPANTGEPLDPVVTITPGTVSITGKARVGNTLTVKSTGWKPRATQLSYQWNRAGKPISGATKMNYRLTPADAKKTITVTVTGRATNATAVSRTASGVKAKLGIIKPKKLTLKGKPRVGKTLKVKTKSWTSGTRLTYRWSHRVKGKWKAVKRGKKAAYKVKASNRGKKLRVTVRGTKPGYKSVTKVLVTKKAR
ncbi:hypothetical protein SAMN06309944_1182 [Micrococcales bacterium KH10]|nr:hypothetical protein SAMN06309944_1182 [Micrococcales bacterium KH10]